MARILIVDDDPKICNTIQRFLTSAGFLEVTIAGTGKDALAKLRSSPFELALLDLYLPAPNGLEILKQIQQSGMPTEVVMISGFGTIKEAVEALNLGARSFLEKPLDFNALLELVQQILAGVHEDPIVAYVRQHCHEINSREEVARTLGMSAKTVSHHISRNTGYTFQEFLHHCRLEKAKNF